MTDATGQRVDEEQTKKRLAEIADAIGRPVTKVILDREDNVVLNLGDIITHQAIQRAHDSGGLDSLLGSVYKAASSSRRKRCERREAQAEATVEKATGGAAVVEDLEGKVATAEGSARPSRTARRPRPRPTANSAKTERGERESARAAEKEAREAEQAAADREAREAEEAAVEPASSSSARTTSPKKVR